MAESYEQVDKERKQLRRRVEELKYAIINAPCPSVSLQLWNMVVVPRVIGSNGLCGECDCWKRKALKEVE